MRTQPRWRNGAGKKAGKYLHFVEMACGSAAASQERSWGETGCFNGMPEPCAIGLGQYRMTFDGYAELVREIMHENIHENIHE